VARRRRGGPEAFERGWLARLARNLAADTPVRAARALGVGFVGIAQSDEHEARLREHGASHVLRDYLDSDAVGVAIAEARAPASGA
jgi:hypothetical protein